MSMERPNVGPTPGTAEYDALKQEINSAGFIKDPEGGEGALFIGSREEIDKAREKAEAEGRAPDLASFIRINKQVKATQEDIVTMDAWRLKKYGPTANPIAGKFADIPKGEASYENNGVLFFKDSAGNLAKVNVKTSNIAEFKGLSDRDAEERIISELNRLGFKHNPISRSLFSQLSSWSDIMKHEQAQEVKTENFSF